MAINAAKEEERHKPRGYDQIMMKDVIRKARFESVPLDSVEKAIVKKYSEIGPPDPKKAR